MPTSAHSGIPILLILFFSSIHTLGTTYDSSWGVWKNKTQSIIIVMSFLSIWLSFDFDLNFIDRLKVMNTWSYDLGILSLVAYFSNMRCFLFQFKSILSTLAHVCEVWILRPIMFVFNILNSVGWHIGWITLACYKIK